MVEEINTFEGAFDNGFSIFLTDGTLARGFSKGFSIFLAEDTLERGYSVSIGFEASFFGASFRETFYSSF